MSFLVIAVILALMIPLLAVILDSQLGRALAARLERDASTPDQGLLARVDVLETEVDRLTGELRRLDEQSEFLQRLIEGRDDTPPSLPPGDRAD